MKKEIKLPEISDGVETATVTEILVSEGDTIERAQSLIVVDSDKASVEVPSDEEGTVESINVKVDDEIKAGDVIITLTVNGEEDGEADDKKEKVEEETERDKSEAIEKKNKSKEEDEDSDEKVEKAESKEKSKKTDQSQKKEKNISKSEKEKDKEESKDKESKAKLEEKELSDKRKDTEDKDGVEEPSRQEEEKTKGKQNKSDDKKKKDAEHELKQEEKSEETEPSAAPNVWRLARSLGVDLKEVKGTGRQGRIMEQDVEAHAKKIIEGKRPASESKVTATLPDFSKWGEVEERPLKSIRKTIAKNTTASWNTMPHVTHFDEAEISEIEDLIESKKHLAEVQGGTLTMTAVLLKIAAEAIREFPKVNASIDMEEKMIIQKKYIHIGVAVDTENGLLVPVIRDVDKKDIIALSVELTDISEKARKGKLSPDEMKGGSFTITNVGGIGGTNFTPLINQYQAAILGVSKAQMKPVWMDGEFKPKLMLPLALSYDHRLIDGADAARFTRWIREVIENPLNLLVE